ncbi:hypothetical protein NMG60_11000066 [Bertholletia excelsa]
MKSERPQPWQISVHATTKYFNFKFEATRMLPTSKLTPFPIKLNLEVKPCPSLLQTQKSELQNSIPKKRKSIKSKFHRVLRKFRPRAFKSKTSDAKQTLNLGHPDAHSPVKQPRRFAFLETLSLSSIGTGLFVLLSQGDQKGLLSLGFVFLICLVLIAEKVIARRIRSALLIPMVAMLGCAIGFYLSCILKISEARLSDCSWKALNYAWSYAISLPRFAGRGTLGSLSRVR